MRKVVRSTSAFSFVLILTLLCMIHASAAIIRVKTDGNDSNDGSTWELAKKTVQAALNTAVSGDEVWVKAGSYLECITLNCGVGLYGGFAGTETARSQRDPSASISVLDGKKSSSNDYASVVTVLSGASSSTVIDGFTIRNGTGTNIAVYPQLYLLGGGLYSASGSPTISNNIFKYNSALVGGGVYCSAASLLNNKIFANSGNGNIYCDSSALVSGNIIALNTGEGIKANGNANIVNNTIAYNSGNGITGSGVGVYSVYNNIVAFNSIGLYCYSGTFSASNNCVYGNSNGNYGGVSPGAGDVNADPVFVDGSCNNLHIQPYSPCVGAGWNGAPGIPSTDTDGQARVLPSDGNVDIGADETDGTIWPTGASVIIHVSCKGNDANDGSTWALAKRTIQAATDAASDLVGGDVWVSSGKYSGNINLRPFAYLYGGFSGTETLRSQRNCRANICTLYGDATNPTVKSEVAGTFSGIDGFTITNGINGVWCSNSSPRILNNRIVGNFRDRGSSSATGAGIYLETSSALIAGNVIAGNTVLTSSANGGGIYCSGGSPTITNNTIAFNLAGTQGGAIYLGSSCAATLSNNIVYANSSGIYKVSSASSTLRNNCVYGNTAYNYSGLSAGTGDISSDPLLGDAVFGGFHIQPTSPCIGQGWNSAPGLPTLDMDLQARVQPSAGVVDIGADESDGTDWTGAPHRVVRVSAGGNDSNDGSSWATPKRTIQAAVDMGDGDVWVSSGIYSESVNMLPFVYLYGGLSGSETSIGQRNISASRTVVDAQGLGVPVITCDGCSSWTCIDGFTIRNGARSSAGGGVNCGTGAPSIMNNRIELNRSGTYGGGIYCGYGSQVVANNVIVGNYASSRGSGLYSSSKASTIAINNTIAYNVGATAVYADGAINLFSNIVCNNIANGVYAFSSSKALLRSNDVFGNATNYDNYLPPGLGDISLDPKFADGLYANLHIQPDSPCRDAGYDAGAQAGWIDMDSQPRFQGSHVDIGADESDGTTWVAGPYTTIRVSSDGNDGNDGSTWSLAKRTIQAASDAVALNGGDIWVKNGTYAENVRLSGLAFLYGGFSGSESLKSQRDWIANRTTIDGQGLASAIEFSSGCGSSGAIDGFVIRNGVAGIECSYASPVIVNNFITNATGAGLYLSYSNSRATCNTITGNARSLGGGGVYNTGGSPYLAGNIITNNTATQGNGGGVLVDTGNLTAENNTIVGNSASGYGGAVSCYQGGAHLNGNIIAYNSSGIDSRYFWCYDTKNDVFSNGSKDYNGSSISKTGDISADPLFADRPGGDFHLTSASLCKNAGYDTSTSLPSKDLDGQLRRNGIVDMGADEYWPSIASLKDVRNSADSTGADIDGLIVSAAFTDYFYAQFADKPIGIRVNKTGHTLTEGMKVRAIGVTKTNPDGEKYILASTASQDTPPNNAGVVNPLFLTNASLGGADLCYNPLTNAGQCGVKDARGPNNVGLLVTINGKVTEKDAAVPATWFKIDDGCGVNVKVVVPSAITDLPNLDQQVAVTGISSCEKSGADILRLLRVRKQADILKF